MPAAERDENKHTIYIVSCSDFAADVSNLLFLVWATNCIWLTSPGGLGVDSYHISSWADFLNITNVSALKYTSFSRTHTALLANILLAERFSELILRFYYHGYLLASKA